MSATGARVAGSRRSRTLLLAVVAVAALAYLAIGLAVAHRPPGAIDLVLAPLVGQATPLAALLTKLGRFEIYFPVCVAVIVAGLVRRVWLGRALSAVAFLIIAEFTSDALKLAFGRARPTHWLVTHETSYSYASGHATLSLVFYGFWAYVAARSTLPRPARAVLIVAPLALSAAIGWSRLALGAHFLTDVLGGYVLGAGLLALEIAVVPERFYRFGREK